MSNPSCLYPRHSACTVQAVEFNFSYSFKTIIKLLCLTIKTSTVEAGGWGVNTSLNQPPIQKCQNFPNESPIVRASRKLPPLVIASHAGVFKIWSLFVCCMDKATQSVLVIQKKLSVTAYLLGLVLFSEHSQQSHYSECWHLRWPLMEGLTVFAEY